MQLIIGTVLLIGTIIGFRQGALKQIASLAGIIVGLVIAAFTYHSFGTFLADKTGATLSVSRLAAFLLIVVLVPIVLGWIAAFLTQVFKRLKINFVNRLLGAAIGLISYALILSVAFNLLDFVTSNAGFRPNKLGTRSSTYYIIKHATQPFIPDALIVTDETEVENGAEPKYGLQPVVNKATQQFNSPKQKK